MRKQLRSLKQFDEQMLNHGIVETMTYSGKAYLMKGCHQMAAEYLHFLFDMPEYSHHLSMEILYDKRQNAKPGDILLRNIIFQGDVATFDVSNGDLEPVGKFAEIVVKRDTDDESVCFHYLEDAFVSDEEEYSELLSGYSNASVLIYINGKQLNVTNVTKCYYDLEHISTLGRVDYDLKYPLVRGDKFLIEAIRAF